MGLLRPHCATCGSVRLSEFGKEAREGADLPPARSLLNHLNLEVVEIGVQYSSALLGKGRAAVVLFLPHRQAILANPGITERLGQGAAKRLQLAKFVPGKTGAKLIEAVGSGDGAHEIMGHG